MHLTDIGAVNLIISIDEEPSRNRLSHNNPFYLVYTTFYKGINLYISMYSSVSENIAESMALTG